jgi:CDP-6-deoxy-D-xylo-4-hexulose-3-dehydrase
MESIDLPLMKNNISRKSLDALISLLQQDDPMLTQSENVRLFEREWSQWLGVKHSLMVNSGSSANLLTMLALREKVGLGEILVPPLTWVSDIASILHAGFTPVFVDINPSTLGMDTQAAVKKVTSRTRAVFPTHILGYDALDDDFIQYLETHDIPLIEDVCESHGATHNGKKLGTFGLVSNFSFYYAHHLSTVEGGMICTDDESIYEIVRMCRSHGMVREAGSDGLIKKYHQSYPDLNPDFIFAYPAYNVRSTELNAVIGRMELKQLDENNARRKENLNCFLDHLDPEKYFTAFRTEGSCNYAFTLVLKFPDDRLRDLIEKAMRKHNVEFRRGTSGGGNQLRQPYLRKRFGETLYRHFPHTEHVHFYGYYIGNYPGLETDKILRLCDLLNGVK